jgi:soluble lytic murein transglycosylase
MRAALEYSPRRRKKRRVNKTRLVLPLLVILLLIFVVYYMFFFPKAVREIAYPLAYQDEIKKYAAAYDLDPARVAAVVYCESSFQPEAVSPAGARGLMQIMPETGGWIAKKLDEAGDYTDEKLFEPELNIRYGCWYLNYLDGRYDGDLTKATAAYHAGGTRVDEWLSDKAYSQDGVTLASIPYDSTRAYVANVKTAYEHYKEIFRS